MRRILVIFCFAVGLSFAPFAANAQYSKEDSPEKFVEKYIELGKSLDYEGIVDLVIDERFDDNRQIKIDTYKAMQQNLPALIGYEIKEVKNVTENTATVVTVLEYEDGSIEQAPMHLVKDNGDWKLSLDSEDARADEDFQEIKQSKFDIVQQSNFNNYPIQALSVRGPHTMSFQYWGRSGGSEFYSIESFDTKVKNSFALIATQSHAYSSSVRVRVTYAIVQEGGFFTRDKIWGSAYKTGSYTSDQFVGAIPKDSGAPRYTNAKLRFETEIGITSSMGYSGTGSLYEY